MGNLRSRLTAQGRISIPAEVRRELGVGPGSVLIWEPRNGVFIVRRAGKHSSTDVHAALFGDEARTGREGTDVKTGIRKYMRPRHARD